MAKPAPNGAPILPVTASGPGNTTSPVTPSCRQLLVALLGVPAAAETDLVEAVAVFVLAEPLLLELLAAGEDVVVGAEALAPSAA